MQTNSLSMAAWQARRLKFSLRCALGAMLGGLAFSLIATHQLNRVPILSLDALPRFDLVQNPNSLSSIVGFLTLAISAIVVALGFRRLTHYDLTASPLERRAATIGKEWIGRFAVSLTVSLMLFGISLAAMLLWARLFEGSAFTRLGVIVLAMGYGGALAFGLAYWSVTLKTRQMFTLAIAFMLYGVVVAGLISADREWWQRSLSALGHDSVAGLIFNLSVIGGGLILLAVAIEEVEMLALLQAAGILKRRGFTVLRFSLIAICVLMIGIGLFPTRVSVLSNVMHNLAAHSMVGVIILLMFTVTAFAPIFPRHFKHVSLGFGVACVGFVALYGLRLLDFLTMEVLIISTCGAWLFYFKMQIEAYACRLPVVGLANS